MNSIYTLSLRDLTYNKKMTLAMIFTIIIVTILINSIITLALSYQEYIVNLCRNKENWEVQIDNIKFENVKYIEQDLNTKQISIIQDLGISNPFDFGIPLHIKSYDYNAMQNLSINLKSGRLPENSNEIIIDKDMNFKIGDTVNCIINGKSFSFVVVGELWNTNSNNFANSAKCAITFCNRDEIEQQENVSVYIISNKISKIYESTNKIIENIKNTEIASNMSISYNDELLSYACVAENGSTFQKTLFISVRIINWNYFNIFISFNI